MRLHKRAIYYVYIATPLLLLVPLAKLDLIGSMAFTVGLLVYALLLSPLDFGQRLVTLGVIPPSELINNFIPFWNNRYFDYLFLGAKLPGDV